MQNNRVYRKGYFLLQKKKKKAIKQAHNFQEVEFQ